MVAYLVYVIFFATFAKIDQKLDVSRYIIDVICLFDVIVTQRNEIYDGLGASVVSVTGYTVM